MASEAYSQDAVLNWVKALPPQRRLNYYLLSAQERNLLSAMYEWEQNGEIVWPSYDCLAIMARMERRSVIRLIRGYRDSRRRMFVPGLVGRGILSEIAPGSAADQRPNTFRVNDDAFAVNPAVLPYIHQQLQGTLPGIDRPAVPGEPITPAPPRLITVKHAGLCKQCARPIGRGQQAYWSKGRGLLCYPQCAVDACVIPGEKGLVSDTVSPAPGLASDTVSPVPAGPLVSLVSTVSVVGGAPASPSPVQNSGEATWTTGDRLDFKRIIQAANQLRSTSTGVRYKLGDFYARAFELAGVPWEVGVALLRRDKFDLLEEMRREESEQFRDETTQLDAWLNDAPSDA